MSSIRGTLLQWLLRDVAPRTLIAVGLADRASALRSAASSISSVDERVRLLNSVQETLDQLGTLESNIWAAVAALSCVERILSGEEPSNALLLAIAGRVAEHAGIHLPRLERANSVSRRGAA